jgi:murein DD-endopeptidase MepM/ murein hydrolase activator NlpD
LAGFAGVGPWTAANRSIPSSQELLEKRDAARAAAERASREAERKALRAKRKAAAAAKARAKAKTERARQRALANAYSLPVVGYHLTARFNASGGLWGLRHTGLDFAAPAGTPVRAVEKGQVIEAGWAGAYGQRLILRHPDGTETWYCHLSRFVLTGGWVAVGQVIGDIGSTGNTTGPHLHLEVHPGGGSPVDPYNWLANRGHQP